MCNELASRCADFYICFGPIIDWTAVHYIPTDSVASTYIPYEWCQRTGRRGPCRSWSSCLVQCHAIANINVFILADRTLRYHWPSLHMGVCVGNTLGLHVIII